MDTRKIAIFTAVRMETRAVRRVIKPVSAGVYTVGIMAGHLPTPFELRGVSVIILCGVAGALDPGLKVGDLILDDPKGLIPAAAPYRRGVIHTADRIIASPAEKGVLFRQTGAPAVDMEQAIVRKFADQLGVSFLGIRAISDTAEETLNPRVLRFVNELGDPQRITIAMTLLRQPKLISYLRQLNKNTQLALANLAPAVKLITKHLQKN